MSALVQNSNQIEDPSLKKSGTRMSAAPKPKKSFWTVNRKLLLPSVALMVTLALGLISYIAYFIVQRNQTEAARDLNRVESSVQGNLTEVQTLSLALASEMASSPQVQAAFASQDRQALQDLTLPIFETVQKDFAVKQYQFILPPATSFLRLHQLDKYDDDLSTFRFTVLAANSTQTPVGGIEIGRGGLGVRGEVPVFYKGKYIGVVDVGIDIGSVFLENLKKQFEVDAQIMLEKNAAQTATFTGATSEISGPTPDLLIQSSTFSEPVYANPTAYSSALKGEKIISRVTTVNGITYSVISSPLRDYSGNVIGVLDIFINRTDIIAAQSRSLILVVVFSALATLIGAFVLVRTINSTIRPIGILTEAASALAGGDLERQAIVHTNDEFSLLANTFNDMTAQLRNSITTLEQNVAERTRGLANVAEISTIASNIQDKEEMLATVVHLVQRRFGLYHAHVFTYRENTEDLQIVACGYKEGDEHEGTHGTSVIPLAQEQSLVARAARSRQPVIVNDVRNDPGWLPNPLLPNTAAELAVPLLVGDKLVGVLDVQSESAGAFSESDADIQLTLGAQVAVAMQNIDSKETITKRASELQNVATISTAAATIADVQKMLETVVHLTQRRFGLYHAHVFTYHEDTQDLQIRACGYKEGDEHEGTHGTAIIPLDQEQSLVARAARTRQAVIVNDVHSDPGWLPNPLLPDTSSEMAVPMIVGDQVLGVLDVQSERLNAFTDEDASIQTTLASQIATALQHARSFSQSQRQAERETAVNLITQKIQNTTSVEAALQMAARELGHALGMKSTLVTLDPEAMAGERKSN